MMRRTIGAALFVAGTLIVASGGSLIAAAGDLLVDSLDNRANETVESSQLRTEELLGALAAIEQSKAVAAVLGDRRYKVEDERLAFVEGERWGVSATLTLDEADALAGPWITVDTDALIAVARPDLSGENLSSGLDHDALAQLLGGAVLSAADYQTQRDSYDAHVRHVLITIKPTTGEILTLTPFEPPPNLWENPPLPVSRDLVTKFFEESR